MEEINTLSVRSSIHAQVNSHRTRAGEEATSADEKSSELPVDSFAAGRRECEMELR